MGGITFIPNAPQSLIDLILGRNKPPLMPMPDWTLRYQWEKCPKEIGGTITDAMVCLIPGTQTRLLVHQWAAPKGMINGSTGESVEGKVEYRCITCNKRFFKKRWHHGATKYDVKNMNDAMSLCEYLFEKEPDAFNI